METLREGIYLGKYVGCGLGATKKHNNPYLYLEFKVAYFHEGNWMDIQPFNTKVFFMLDERNIQTSLKYLNDLGFNNDFRNPQFTNLNKEQLVYSRQGNKEYWDLRKFKESPRQSIPDNIIDALNAKAQAFAKFRTPSKPTQAAAGDNIPAEPTPAPQPESEEEIPF